MHYIRLLRPPAITQTGTKNSVKNLVKVVLTITTDLGESFLCPDSPIKLDFNLEHDVPNPATVQETNAGTTATRKRKFSGTHEEESGGGTVGSTRDGGTPETTDQVTDPPTSSHPRTTETVTTQLQAEGKSTSSVWRAGMRVLKVELVIPQRIADKLKNASTDRPTGNSASDGPKTSLMGLGKDETPPRLLIQPADSLLSAVYSNDLLQKGQGLIMPVWSELAFLGQEPEHHSSRRLVLGDHGDDNSGPVSVVVEEEIGESIARHVWDAGVMTVALLQDICSTRTTRKYTNTLPELRKILLDSEELRILELGSGVGILGIGAAQILGRCRSPYGQKTFFLLTDLHEAEDQARRNISIFEGSQTPTTDPGTSIVKLEWGALDWDLGRKGLFGDLKTLRSTPFDLVMLSDCTYNVDMLPSLVGTLSALHDLSRGMGKDCKVLLATKPRHPSEKELFKLMSEERWSIAEEVTLPLAVLASEDEQVEVYLFHRRA